MKVLMEAKHIRGAIKKLRPSSVAVAYVGTNWRQFVSLDHLREIVLSPTLGSNPKAIEDLMHKLGHEHVHFLDDLHAKIYLGSNEALVGSCNLSDNGIQEGGLFEAAVLLDEPHTLTRLASQIEVYKGHARTLYPSKAAKLARLKRLQDQTQRAVWCGVQRTPATSPPISDYTSALDRIHIAWYENDGDEFRDDVIHSTLPEARGQDPNRYFSDTLQFHAGDDIRVGDWILCWFSNPRGSARHDGTVSWMQVHHVIPNGFDSNEYPMLVGQAKSQYMKHDLPPFALDDETKAAIRQLINSGEFPELRWRDGRTWRVTDADSVTPKFLAALKQRLKR